MFDGLLAFAFVAGMVATVNPCGFALLPAYLSLFLGSDPGGRPPVGRALKVSAAMTLGFVVTFGAAGAVLSPIMSTAGQYLPWITIVIGIGLIGLGIFLLTGRQLLLRVPHMNSGGKDRSFRSMFVFGVSYAVASLSCTIGPFLAATSGGLRGGNVVEGWSAFVAYGLGMGAVVTALTVAAAFAQEGLTRKLRRVMPFVPRIAGGLLVVAGAYVAWYGWWEQRVLSGEFVEDPVVDTALGIQSALTTWIDDHGVTALVAFAVLTAVVSGIVWWRARGRPEPEPEPA